MARISLRNASRNEPHERGATVAPSPNRNFLRECARGSKLEAAKAKQTEMIAAGQAKLQTQLAKAQEKIADATQKTAVATATPKTVAPPSVGLPYALLHALGTKGAEQQQAALAGSEEDGHAPEGTAETAQSAPAASATPPASPATSEEDAKKAFRTEMNEKYRGAGDRYPVKDVRTLGGKVITAETLRASNPFVGEAELRFIFVLTSLGGVERKISSIQKLEETVAQNNDPLRQDIYPMLLNNAKEALTNKEAYLSGELSNLKKWATQYDVAAETEAFFADYAEFKTGERLSLQQLYETYGIA